MNHKFPYRWTLADTVFTKDKGKVFSCFACGGGSTMGYKLAGFDVIGCNEIDPKMMDAYKANHNPEFAFLEPIQTFKLRKDLPRELYELDILDGSPPCSSFSMAGNREKDWGKEKKFREGQALQVLDNLFFDFIDLAKELQPKIVVAENVKGLLQGGAKSYVRQIYRDLDLAGYYCQHFLLDASKMGVPQRRERVFFIALRKDLATPFLKQVDLFCIRPELKMEFNFPKIKFGEFALFDGRPLSIHCKKAWDFREKGDRSIADAKARAGMKVSDCNNSFVYQNKVLSTITGKGEFTFTLFDKPIYISSNELIMGGTFPSDYDFRKNKPGYLIGMSVPPVMVAQIATKIWEQWLSKLN
jgi:DNA (cytosine-5)-methyltransferase 1